MSDRSQRRWLEQVENSPNYDIFTSNTAERPYSHVSASRISTKKVQLITEGVEMCHINMQKKKTDNQIVLLQNRLDLLRR
jgi:hypothetical protein